MHIDPNHTIPAKRRRTPSAAALLAPPALDPGGGDSSYPNGAEGFIVAALPPPGDYLIDDLTYYGADSFRNDGGGRLFDNFTLDMVANTLRFIRVTRHKIFGASWALHALIPLVNVERQFTPYFPRESDYRLGLGDIIVDPFILGCPGKHWHITTDPPLRSALSHGTTYH